MVTIKQLIAELERLAPETVLCVEDPDWGAPILLEKLEFDEITLIMGEGRFVQGIQIVGPEPEEFKRELDPDYGELAWDNQ